MNPPEPILTVVFFSALAAAAAALGTVPAAFPGGTRPSWMGCMTTLASGLMLGSGYILMAEVIGGALPLPPILGAAFGVAYTFWTHRLSGTE